MKNLEDKLQKLEITPDAVSWEKLNTKLQVERQPVVRNINIVKQLTIAASFLVLVGISVWLVQTKNSNSTTHLADALSIQFINAQPDYKLLADIALTKNAYAKLETNGVQSPATNTGVPKLK